MNMNHNVYPMTVNHTYLNDKPPIVPHHHDILCGRGVHIARHPGNERFRALVKSRHDESYCFNYTIREKRAVSKEIVDYIKSLDPPGRFLKRSGRTHNSRRGLSERWEELSEREARRKTCQALRDCNRTDRSGYAASVNAPNDVKENVEKRSGMTNKEHAAIAAASLVTDSRVKQAECFSDFNCPRAQTHDGSGAANASVSADIGGVDQKQYAQLSYSPTSVATMAEPSFISISAPSLGQAADHVGPPNNTLHYACPVGLSLTPITSADNKDVLHVPSTSNVVNIAPRPAELHHPQKPVAPVSANLQRVQPQGQVGQIVGDKTENYFQLL